MPLGKSCYELNRYIVVIGTLNFEFRLQSGPHAVQNTLWNTSCEQWRNLGYRWQFAFSVEKCILDFTEQIFWQIKSLL